MNPETRRLPRADTLERGKDKDDGSSDRIKNYIERGRFISSLRLVYEAMKKRILESKEKFRLRQELRRERNRLRKVQRAEKRRRKIGRKILEETTKVE